MLRLSDLTQKELETKLLANLETKLPYVDPTKQHESDAGLDEEPAAPEQTAPQPAASSEGDAGPPVDPAEAHKALLKELGYGAVKALASELRTIAALGFDEP
ncbi:MAG: hypothetical protein RLZZ450_1722 [Pseudomonadota bacterium]|jgi:hypothetical protein